MKVDMTREQEIKLWEILCKTHFYLTTHPNEVFTGVGMKRIIEKMMKIIIGEDKPILTLIKKEDLEC